MRPDNPRITGPIVPQRPLLRPISDPHQQAAANVVRTQLDHIYSGHTSTPTPQTTPVATPAPNPALAGPVPLAETADSAAPADGPNPYDRTQSNLATVEADQWQQYHSAWQDYYQKYYERYYLGHMYRTRQALEQKAAAQARAAVQTQPATPAPVSPAPAPAETFSANEAMYDLRASLRQKVQTSATKVRRSRHFVPITAAACVVLLFLFLQYNRILIANVEAYISPGSIDPANLIVDPTTSAAVDPSPKVIIPKINVDVPVDYNSTPDYDSQMAAMQNGLAYFGIPGADSKPGQIGNTVLSGHSSNDIIDKGDYKFIFARLDQLQKGDTIYVDYHSVRYVYTVTKKQVVAPTDVQALVYPTTKPVLTLITCTPLGTALNRLLVTAEQVSPDPSTATPAPESGPGGEPQAIPGNSPTFIQRIFGDN